MLFRKVMIPSITGGIGRRGISRGARMELGVERNNYIVSEVLPLIRTLNVLRENSENNIYIYIYILHSK